MYRDSDQITDWNSTRASARTLRPILKAAGVERHVERVTSSRDRSFVTVRVPWNDGQDYIARLEAAGTEVMDALAAGGFHPDRMSLCVGRIRVTKYDMLRGEARTTALAARAERMAAEVADYHARQAAGCAL